MKHFIFTACTVLSIIATYQFVRDMIESTEMDDVEFQTRYDAEWKVKK